MPQHHPELDLSGIERELFGLLSARAKRLPSRTFQMAGVDVPEPPQQVPDFIPVTGSPLLQRLVNLYSSRLPWLGQYVKGVSESVTPAAASMAEESGIPWDRTHLTNLGGAFDTISGDIYINPSLPPNRMESILAHELAHSLGYNDNERDISNIEGLAQMREDALEMSRPRSPGFADAIEEIRNVLKKRLVKRS